MEKTGTRISQWLVELTRHYFANFNKVIETDTKQCSQEARQCIDRVSIQIEDDPMTSLGIDILKHILGFISLPLSYFAFTTCSSWYRLGRESFELKEGIEASELAAEAAHDGYLSLLQYIVAQKSKQFKEDNHHIIDVAASGGQIECIKYLKEEGWKLSKTTCVKAVFNGHLTLLQYLKENGCEWDEDVTCIAAARGEIECLKYLKENGCEWDGSTINGAARYGHFECLKYAHENGCEWKTNNNYICINAASSGNVDCLKYAHENGCMWDAKVCAKAAKKGHFECLKYAHENGCKWDSSTCAKAVKRGHFECLKYAHENGCECNSRTHCPD